MYSTVKCKTAQYREYKEMLTFGGKTLALREYFLLAALPQSENLCPFSLKLL